MLEFYQDMYLLPFHLYSITYFVYAKLANFGFLSKFNLKDFEAVVQLN